MTPRSALLLLAPLAATLGHAASPVGAWTGRLDAQIPTFPASMPPAQRAAADRMVAQIKNGRIYLTLKADHTYSTRIVGLPTLGTESKGAWSQRGSVVTMREARAGVKPQDFTMGKDGRTLPFSFPHGRMLFTR